MRSSLMVLVLLVGAARPAGACSCVARTAAQYFADAAIVFVARAGKRVTEAGREVQPLAVIEALKGKPGPLFRHARAAASSTCDRLFTPGEVTVVFVDRKGGIGVCGGNYVLDVQLRELEQLLRLGASKLGAPPLASFAAALATLQPYLHGRPRIPVRHASLAGKSLQLGKSTLPFVAAAEAGEIEITRALERGRVTLISGRYGAEGYHFDVLLEQSAKGPLVIKHWGRETRTDGRKR